MNVHLQAIRQNAWTMPPLTCLEKPDTLSPMGKLPGTLLGLLLLSSCTYELPRSTTNGQEMSSSSGSGTITSSGGAGGGGGASAGGSGGSAAGGGGAAEQPPCHPAGLEDGFDGTVVDPDLWSLQGKQSIMSVTGGQLQVTPDDNIMDGQWVGLVTKTTYNLTDCAVWIEAPSIVKNGAAGSTYWQLHSPNGSSAFKVADGNLETSVDDSGTKLGQASIPYVASEHRWWRIREAAGNLIMETSSNFTTWTTVLSTPTPSYISEISIGLGVISPTNQTSLGKTTFDHFNIVP